jgi:hypothetical protein
MDERDRDIFRSRCVVGGILVAVEAGLKEVSARSFQKDISNVELGRILDQVQLWIQDLREKTKL